MRTQLSEAECTQGATSTAAWICEIPVRPALVVAAYDYTTICYAQYRRTGVYVTG